MYKTKKNHGMKNLSFLMTLAVVVLFSACQSKKAEQTNESVAYELSKLMTEIDQKVDQEISVEGIVTHVCKHSGKKCFITDETGKVSIQIMSGGEIETFDKELVGSRIQVKGIVKESQQLSPEDLQAQEDKVLAMQTEGTLEEEQCDTERASIEDMRKWMKEHNKEVFTIYRIDGLSYEALD